MSEQTTSSIVIDAEPAAVMAVIADFEAYPTWARGVRTTEVRSERDGLAEQVFIVLDVPPIRDEYTLAYDWQGNDEVTWHLVEGKVLTAMDGAYTLRDLGDGTTEATYRLTLDLSVPLIGMIKRKGEKMIIDAALKGLKKRVESL
jgi:ribosome-associated toxin RatA of RatAB toxin-antitoxin module